MPRSKDLKQRKSRSDRQQPMDFVCCKDCGRKTLRCNLSKARLCFRCSAKRSTESISQLRDKQGEYYEKWRAARERGLSKMKGGNHV